jgi:hypothetical protein
MNNNSGASEHAHDYLRRGIALQYSTNYRYTELVSSYVARVLNYSRASEPILHAHSSHHFNCMQHRYFKEHSRTTKVITLVWLRLANCVIANDSVELVQDDSRNRGPWTGQAGKNLQYTCCGASYTNTFRRKRQAAQNAMELAFKGK